ncbi:MAG: acyl-CoA ligase (AMP-forming), exosortase A system-associated [Motiliproteus sp.]
MGYLFHHLVSAQATLRAEHQALVYKQQTLNYTQLWRSVQRCAAGFQQLDLARQERVAVYLPKQPETISALFGTSLAGGSFVPVNPVLKPPQVGHILNDCNARILVTNRARALQLVPVLAHCHDLRWVVLVDADTLHNDTIEPVVKTDVNTGAGSESDTTTANSTYRVMGWQALTAVDPVSNEPTLTDSDMAAILYTSGSTGKPKGVVLSHRNLMVGASSVSSYIGNHDQDHILALLPLSFDAGLSQITTAFASGACCVLLDFLLPNDVLKQVVKHRITGITAVPPLWHQIANLKWTEESASTLRYFANTGGHMPQSLLQKLRTIFRTADPFLMYGLTEAFRSTYLPPADVDRKPGSIGKAIPNAEVLILRPDGSECQANEVGELVHRGPLVAQGYWNDAQRTAERFKPVPSRAGGLVFDDRAVWSGDSAKRDEEGYLYFVGRQDEMIKTSGYRVSPSEVEEVAYSSGLVGDAVALGITHPTLGQAVLLFVSELAENELPVNEKLTNANLSTLLLQRCRTELPNFMVPQAIVVNEQSLPRNPNGKFDRKQLSEIYRNHFTPSA